MNGLGRPYGWVALAMTPMVPWLGSAPGGAWLAPLLAPLTVWPLFRRAVLGRRSGSAFAVSLVWACLYSVGVVAMVQLVPEIAQRAVLRGENYRAEMFDWILSGGGAEVDPRSFLPVHAAHLGAFLVLASGSGGYLGLSLGAFLVGYMSFFVGSFAVASGAPVLGALVAWVPWSVIRVLSFVLLGVLASRPLLLRERFPFGSGELRLGLVALGGLALDALMKSFWAPAYGDYLRGWLMRSGGM